MAFNNVLPAPAMVPTSITQAINFLTRPLILTQSPDIVACFQSILRTTLQAAYAPSRDSHLVLSFSATSLPPRPVYAACIASGINWSDWISLLGAREFDLIIMPHSVLVTYDGVNPQTVVVWSESTLTPARRSLLARLNIQEPQVPISKLGQQSMMQASLRATVSSALARVQTRTLAQQLLESDHKEEADEIFAMISKTAIMSPTPTREKFALDSPALFVPSTDAFPSPLSSPEAISSPDSSRPSSRSSTFSSFSFSSDDESATSVSSISSFDFLASTKPAATIKTPINTFNKRAPVFVPRQQQPRAAAAAPRVFIDNTKKDVTKYLYQGGVSTVLTGGVMLGGGAAPSAKAKAGAEQVPKYRAPVGGRKLPTPTQNAASASSWRRTARV